MKHFPKIQSRIQHISTNQDDVSLYILREDEIHPTISGNKYRKLKYNLVEFQKGNYQTLLTFGGAYSNHISATAAAGKEFGIKTIGIIRGEELINKISENPTLRFAEECGMKFKFIRRSDYREKSNPEFLNALKSEFGKIYILPEGGTNSFAVKGCEEILGNHTEEFDVICVAIGTGGTISGIVNSAKEHQQVIGFPALKDSDFLYDEIKKYSNRSNFKLIQDYHFGGYGKVSEKLIKFINKFKQEYAVTLDPIYTGKMLFGIEELIQQNYFPKGTRILAIHTSGLQGIEGMNQKLKKQNKLFLV